MVAEGVRRFNFLLFKTMPIFWAERISVLIVFTCLGFQTFRFPDFQTQIRRKVPLLQLWLTCHTLFSSRGAHRVRTTIGTQAEKHHARRYPALLSLRVLVEHGIQLEVLHEWRRQHCRCPFWCEFRACELLFEIRMNSVWFLCELSLALTINENQWFSRNHGCVNSVWILCELILALIINEFFF